MPSSIICSARSQATEAPAKFRAISKAPPTVNVGRTANCSQASAPFRATICFERAVVKARRSGSQILALGLVGRFHFCRAETPTAADFPPASQNSAAMRPDEMVAKEYLKREYGRAFRSAEYFRSTTAG